MGANEDANVQAVMKIYQAFGNGDIEGIIAMLDAGIDWEFYGPESIPFAGHHRGHQEILRFFGTIAETIEVESFGPEAEFLAAGDRVAVPGHERVRVKANGNVFETHWLHLFTFRDGKVVRLREYYDTAAMQAAFTGGNA